MDLDFTTRGLKVNVFSGAHTLTKFHTQVFGDKAAETRIAVDHFPKDTKGVHGPREEVYMLTVEQVQRGEDSDKHRDGLCVYMDRETLEAIHFAAGEMLEQSKGIADNAAPGRSSETVVRSKGCYNCDGAGRPSCSVCDGTNEPKI